VLRGELSVVGSHLFTTAPGQAVPPLPMIDIKPGLIAWTHPRKGKDVSGTDNGVHYQVDCDIYYIEHLSIFFDMKMIIRFLSSNMAWRRDVMQ
jgi:lipopolysaccharide/colanic/teichoic acid biosynthesis glycosyltransferase